LRKLQLSYFSLVFSTVMGPHVIGLVDWLLCAASLHTYVPFFLPQTLAERPFFNAFFLGA
jgi:hypothetical protein